MSKSYKISLLFRKEVCTIRNFIIDKENGWAETPSSKAEIILSSDHFENYNFNFHLHDRTAAPCLTDLYAGLINLGVQKKQEPHPTKANTGYYCALFLGWAMQHKYGTWKIEEVSTSL